MKIFGEEIKKEELIKMIGDITQLGGIKLYEYIDGVSRGIRAAEIKTPCGIDMNVLIDRGMDISSLFYKNIPIAWKSATKETSPTYYESKGAEWLRTFFGGLLTTCGLTYMGPANFDNNEELGLHGRISNISAENINTNIKWRKDDIVLEIIGKVRESKVFGDKIELTRKITTFMATPRIIIEDTVENIGFMASPLMVLYHINIGYPVLNKNASLIEGKAKVSPRDEEANKDFKNYNNFPNPIPDFKEQVYLHDIQPDNNGFSHVAIINKKFNNGEGIGIALSFKKESLPYLIQWKQVGEGEYTCGIEPSNCLVRGRSVERKENNLKFIKSGEIIKFNLEFDILSSNKKIMDFKSKYCN